MKDKTKKNQFRIDYAIGSNFWPHNNISGLKFTSEILNECTAVGYSVSGKQALPISNKKLHIECVGLPPYPGEKFPRIAGMLSVDSNIKYDAPHIYYHEGDATKLGGRDTKIIAHIVNDKTTNWGGGGFAVSLKKRYPKSQRDFREWAFFENDNLKLGRAHFVTLDDDLHAFSMIAQHGFGKSNTPRIRYRALATCLTNLGFRAEKLNASIHMPRIGAGNAGGEWSVVEEIIHDTLANKGIKVNIYDFPRPKKNLSLQL